MRYTDLKSSKIILGFFGFFRIFCWGVRGFFWVNNPSLPKLFYWTIRRLISGDFLEVIKLISSRNCWLLTGIWVDSRSTSIERLNFLVSLLSSFDCRSVYVYTNFGRQVVAVWISTGWTTTFEGLAADRLVLWSVSSALVGFSRTKKMSDNNRSTSNRIDFDIDPSSRPSDTVSYVLIWIRLVLILNNSIQNKFISIHWNI